MPTAPGYYFGAFLHLLHCFTLTSRILKGRPCTYLMWREGHSSVQGFNIPHVAFTMTARMSLIFILCLCIHNPTLIRQAVNWKRRATTGVHYAQHYVCFHSTLYLLHAYTFCAFRYTGNF